ncbi:MAG: hypothetical protein HOP04_06390 [Methylophilaceae bacterium]|nr:hypothetical protein [Methylophilaceae bacterium]
MVASSRMGNQVLLNHWLYKITDADIETKEDQFINEAVDYHKMTKVRPKKEVAFTDENSVSKKFKPFRFSVKKSIL